MLEHLVFSYFLHINNIIHAVNNIILHRHCQVQAACICYPYDKKRLTQTNSLNKPKIYTAVQCAACIKDSSQNEPPLTHTHLKYILFFTLVAFTVTSGASSEAFAVFLILDNRNDRKNNNKKQNGADDYCCKI